MKIAIDIRPLDSFDNRFRGIGTYIYNLVESILAIDSKNEYLFIAAAGNGDRESRRWLDGLATKSNGRVRIKELPALDSLSLKNQALLYRVVNSEKVDIFHSPVQGGLPWFKPYKTVVTVHELVHLVFPDKYLDKYLVGRRYRLEYMARIRATAGATKIITISQNTKKDVIKFLKVPGDRISVVYNGVSEKFKPVQDNGLFNRLKTAYRLKERFIMYAGGFEERKNILRILKAFRLAKNNMPDSTTLLMVGKLDSEGEALLKGISDRSLFNDVIFSGFVKEEELVSLYNACELFLFPTLYEGFGLPALEAMACSKAVIVANNSSLSEITGDTGYQVDPYDEVGIAEGIRVLLSDRVLRSRLEGKAGARAKDFSWTRAASETVKVYGEAFAS